MTVNQALRSGWPKVLAVSMLLSVPRISPALEFAYGPRMGLTRSPVLFVAGGGGSVKGLGVEEAGLQSNLLLGVGSDDWGSSQQPLRAFRWSGDATYEYRIPAARGATMLGLVGASFQQSTFTGKAAAACKTLADKDGRDCEISESVAGLELGLGARVPVTWESGDGAFTGDLVLGIGGIPAWTLTVGYDVRPVMPWAD